MNDEMLFIVLSSSFFVLRFWNDQPGQRQQPQQRRPGQHERGRRLWAVVRQSERQQPERLGRRDKAIGADVLGQQREGAEALVVIRDRRRGQCQRDQAKRERRQRQPAGLPNASPAEPRSTRSWSIL